MQIAQKSTNATPLAPVSVVIPAYNVEAFIAAALDSVAVQTLLPCEVVVVDDGSRDGSVERVRAWQAAHSSAFEVRLVTQPNAGASAARNLGIRTATAPWVALLDADDLWDTEHLALLLEAATLLPGTVAAYGAGRVECDGRLVEKLYDDFWDNPSKALGRPLLGDVAGRLKLDFGAFARLARGNFIKPSSLIFKRDEALAAGLFNETLRTAEDREFLVRLLRRGDFIYVPTPVTTYRWHTENLSHSKNARRNAENGLRALKVIVDNRDLGLTVTEGQACREIVRAAAPDYLYLCAEEGAVVYGKGLQFLRSAFGWTLAVCAPRLAHLRQLIRPTPINR